MLVSLVPIALFVLPIQSELQPEQLYTVAPPPVVATLADEALVQGPIAPSELAMGGPLSILETATAAGRFGTLAAALNAADLVTTLSGPGQFTVFAPTDAAFAKFDQARLSDLLQPENKERLTNLLTFHVAAGSLEANQVLSSSFISTVSGQRATIDPLNIEIEGARFLATNIVCSNGIIHVIDEVILPELRTVTGYVATDPNFSTLYTALQVAGLNDDLLTPGPFTVFAPTNAAFSALPAGVLDSLIADPAALGNILLYHVTSGRLYAEDVLAASSFTMLNNGTTTIGLSGGSAFINSSQITVTDVQVANGVIHVIDAVLVPGP
jgi:transforming growth factor-beta-induced protein